MVDKLKRFLSYSLAIALAVPVSLFINYGAVSHVLAAATSSSAGPNSASVFADDNSVGTRTWSAPSNAQYTDESYASFTSTAGPETSHYLKATNFNLNVPSGATVDGIEVSVKRTATSTSVKDSRVYLVKNGSVVGSNHLLSSGAGYTTCPSPATGTDCWTTAVNTVVYGGPSDKWGATWNSDDINNELSGFVFSAVRSAGSGSTKTISVDSIYMTVYYTLPNVAPGVPAQISPDDGSNIEVTDGTELLSWMSSIDPDDTFLQYQVEYDGINQPLTSSTSSEVDATNVLTTHTWRVRAFDGTDYSDWSPLRTLFFVDTTGPTTEDNTKAGWNNEPVKVKLSCDDGLGVGCATTYYTTDGSKPTTSSAQGNTIKIKNEGVYVIKYFSVDNLGNAGEVKRASHKVKIDMTSPYSELSQWFRVGNVYGPNSWGGVITGFADDLGNVQSGVDNVKVILTDPSSNEVSGYDPKETAVDDYGNWLIDVPSGDLNMAGDGEYTIQSTAYDKAGNPDEGESVTEYGVSEFNNSSDYGSFIWDSKGPEVTGVLDGTTYNEARTIGVSDANEIVYITLNDQPFISGTKVSQNGEYALLAIDEVQNKTVVHFTIDIAPVISGEASSNVTKNSATITWTTDQPATSKVVFDTVSHSLGAKPNYGYAYWTVEDSNKVTNHTVIITGLIAGAKYYYRVVSQGSPETVSLSENILVTTADYLHLTPVRTNVSRVATTASLDSTVAEVNPDPVVAATTTVTSTETATPEVKGSETEKEEATQWWVWLILAIAVLLAGYGIYAFYKKDEEGEEDKKKNKK